MAGSVKQSIAPLGNSGNYAVTFYWTADPNGSVPVATADLGAAQNLVQGFRLLQVGTKPGTPAPTNGYTLAIKDTQLGIDMMGGSVIGLSSTSPQIFPSSSATPPINGSFQLVISGQLVGNAQGVVVVYFGPTQLINSNAGSPGQQGPPGPAGEGVVTVTTYDFPAQTIGDTLTAAVPATITLSPVPLGVNGNDTNHYLYIRNGVGTAEAVLITGGNAAAGSVTGTIEFTPANNHSGAWTIESASDGIKEADIAAVEPAMLFLPDGDYNLYAPLVLSAGNGLRGASINSVQITQTFATGHGIQITGGSPGEIEVSNFSVQASVSVNTGYYLLACISCKPLVHDLFMDSGYGHILFDACAQGVAYSLNLVRYALGIKLGGTVGDSGMTMSDIIGSSDTVNCTTLFLRRGLIDLSNFNFQHSAASGSDSIIVIAPLIGETMGESTITNGTFDGSQLAAIRFLPAIGSNCYGWAFSNLMFTGGSSPSHRGISTATLCLNMQFSNLQFRGVGDLGKPTIEINGGSSLSFDQITISDYSYAGCIGIDVGVGTLVKGFSLTNSRIGLTSQGNQDANCAYALNFNGLAHTNVVFGDNDLFGATATILSPTLAFTRWAVANNLGLKNLGATVAAGATTAFPFMDDGEILTLTGATVVTTVSQLRAGQFGTIIPTNATPGAWSAGATIGNTFAPVQNVPFTFVFDGTKIWLTGNQ